MFNISFRNLWTLFKKSFHVRAITFTKHILFAFLIRVALIIYGEIHDELSEVPYTDIDYKVFTDAARYVVEGGSPYLRHTYRYSPLLSIMMIPNILVYETVGKWCFSLIDILVAVILKQILLQQFKLNKNKENTDETEVKIAENCALLWLYNPLSIIISTRGNADSLAAFLVLATQYFFQRKENTLRNIALSGTIHALAIHFRLYPIAFSLPMFLSLGDNNGLKRLLPNKKQVTLVASCIITLIALTKLFYDWYGEQFIFETYLYHLIRKDTRHNFSVYFYLQYLSADLETGIWQKILSVAPQLVLLLVVSFQYGRPNTLNFCLLCQAIIMVAYNSVVTSQYFIWFLSLLPLCIPDLRLTLLNYCTLAGIWGIAQLAWLFPAYLLEFRGQDVFLFIWLQGIAFFCANLFVLARIIKSYSPSSQK